MRRRRQNLQNSVVAVHECQPCGTAGSPSEVTRSFSTDRFSQGEARTIAVARSVPAVLWRRDKRPYIPMPGYFLGMRDLLAMVTPPDPELVDLIEWAFLEGQIESEVQQLASAWLTVNHPVEHLDVG